DRTVVSTLKTALFAQVPAMVHSECRVRSNLAQLSRRVRRADLRHSRKRYAVLSPYPRMTSPRSSQNRHRRRGIIVTITVLAVAFLAIGSRGSIDVCTKCGAMCHRHVTLVAFVPVYWSTKGMASPLNESLQRWNLVPQHEHEWEHAIYFLPSGFP